VFAVVRELNAQGVTILLVEQNVHHALSVAARAYVYDTGRITVSRPARELLDDRELLAAYLGGTPAPARAGITTEN
jgi:branched-chain amino acid transport system ATP-binding protein